MSDFYNVVWYLHWSLFDVMINSICTNDCCCMFTIVTGLHSWLLSHEQFSQFAQIIDSACTPLWNFAQAIFTAWTPFWQFCTDICCCMNQYYNQVSGDEDDWCQVPVQWLWADSVLCLLLLYSCMHWMTCVCPQWVFFFLLFSPATNLLRFRFVSFRFVLFCLNMF